MTADIERSSLPVGVQNVDDVECLSDEIVVAVDGDVVKTTPAITNTRRATYLTTIHSALWNVSNPLVSPSERNSDLLERYTHRMTVSKSPR